MWAILMKQLTIETAMFMLKKVFSDSHYGEKVTI